MSSPSLDLPPNFNLAAFVSTDADVDVWQQRFDQAQIRITAHRTVADFIRWLDQNRHDIDALLLQTGPHFPELVKQLYQRAILLPALILSPPSSEGAAPQNLALSPDPKHPTSPIKCYYHQAEVALTDAPEDDTPPWEKCLEQAINDFLKLRTQSFEQQSVAASELLVSDDDHHQQLIAQQHRLAEKLRARLGYLGVYYKREQRGFFRHLSPEEQEELTEGLRNEYRAIVISYFDPDADVNVKIDNLVDQAFFADISVAKIVEIHISLMDEFSKQLKLEGRSPEILLDYRLTLIDVISHLGEMYRRSIPRES